MKTKSFTLIELLVVIVIIGILAGVIIVSTSSSINKANLAKAQSFSNTVQNELLLNLISEWTFDEGGAEDTWSNNDGTVSGATYVQKSENRCVYGGCYSFDGYNNYIEVANSNSLQEVYTGLTVSAWVNYTEIQPGTDVLGYIIHKNNTMNESNAPYVLSIGGRRIRWQIYNGTTRVSIQTDLDYNDGNWHHAIGIYNGANILLYVDGSLLKTTAVTSFVNNNGYLSIGGTRYDPLYRPFKGLIDDARIYNAALTTAQIKQEYIAGLNSLLANGNISKEEYDQRLNNLAYEN